MTLRITGTAQSEDDCNRQIDIGLVRRRFAIIRRSKVESWSHASGRKCVSYFAIRNGLPPNLSDVAKPSHNRHHNCWRCNVVFKICVVVWIAGIFRFRASCDGKPGWVGAMIFFSGLSVQFLGL